MKSSLSSWGELLMAAKRCRLEISATGLNPWTRLNRHWMLASFRNWTRINSLSCCQFLLAISSRFIANSRAVIATVFSLISSSLSQIVPNWRGKIHETWRSDGYLQCQARLETHCISTFILLMLWIVFITSQLREFTKNMLSLPSQIKSQFVEIQFHAFSNIYTVNVNFRKLIQASVSTSCDDIDV